MKIQIINKSGFKLPEYATSQSAGFDLRTTKDLVLYPHDSILAPTGLYMAIPPGYEAQVRPRSGLALKQKITVLNTPGTIDADYRGEIGVILINHSNARVDFKAGDKIAQMVIAKHETAEWEPVEVLDGTERGGGGFGHSGVSDKMTREEFMGKHNFDDNSLAMLNTIISAGQGDYIKTDFLVEHNFTRQQIQDYKAGIYGYNK